MIKPLEIASATKITEATKPTPRIAWKASTTGAIDQIGTISTNAGSRCFTCSTKPLAG